MSREELLKQAVEYKEAVSSAEAKKPAAHLFSIDGKFKTIGTAAYYPDEDTVRITVSNGGEIKIPGEAIHSLRLMLEKLDD